MKKLFFLRDNIFATIFVFLCIIIFSFSFIHIGPLNPISKAVSDFDFADLLFNHRAEVASENKDIILINIGKDRSEIAKQIEIINQQKPAVIVLDAWFGNAGDPVIDSILTASLAGANNLVMGVILENDSNGEVSGIQASAGDIGKQGSAGFLNLVGENEKTIRYFSPRVTLDTTLVFALGAQAVKKYNPDAFSKYLSRKNKAEYINYRYPASSFTRFDTDEIKAENKELEKIKGKIVIIGQMGEKLQNSTLEDLHFTPFNHELSARSYPDHYGVYIHANIIAMMLAGDYVNSVPDWIIWLISIFVCYLHMVFFIHYYVEKHIWFHLAAKTIQLISSIIIVWCSIWLLDSYNLKINSGYILAPVILSVDLLYFYDGLVKWLHKKYGYHTYFMSHHKAHI